MRRRSLVIWLGICLLVLTGLAILQHKMRVAQPPSITANPTHAASANGSTANAHPGARTPMGCNQIGNLRELGKSLTYFTNPRTGDLLEYTVIGDGAQSDEVLLMFPGTGETLPDWPVEMLTNSQYSPAIRKTLAYLPAEDGNVSLCHSYRIVLFDLPGVGKSALHGNVTANQIANDSDAMLDDAARTYGIATNNVDLVGWSLGTAYALKYALLAPKANPSRKVRNLVLIAVKPGGNTDGFVDGNAAQCIATILGAMKSVPAGDRLLEARLQNYAFELTFPYRNQKPYNGLDSGCTASVDLQKRKIELNVQTTCGESSICRKTIADQLLNRKTSPWSLTGGVSDQLYVQQREQASDYSLCYCSAASNDFHTSDCHCSQPVEMSETNGGLCQTTSNPPNRPVSTHCSPFSISGAMTVINGPEDLFIQHVYGRALIEAYQGELGASKARLVTYPGADGAGHGVLLQHPKWTQAQIWNALNPARR